jgi:hypothetical protein
MFLHKKGVKLLKHEVLSGFCGFLEKKAALFVTFSGFATAIC